jgi:hypothetical protein
MAWPYLTIASRRKPDSMAVLHLSIYTVDCGKKWVHMIDDLLTLHSLDFVGVKTGENTDDWVHVAMVIRILKTRAQFYTDTSTMRLTGKLLRSADKNTGEPSCVDRGDDLTTTSGEDQTYWLLAIRAARAWRALQQENTGAN